MATGRRTSDPHRSAIIRQATQIKRIWDVARRRSLVAPTQSEVAARHRERIRRQSGLLFVSTCRKLQSSVVPDFELRLLPTDSPNEA